jgi:hypothetical protein
MRHAARFLLLACLLLALPMAAGAAGPASALPASNLLTSNPLPSFMVIGCPPPPMECDPGCSPDITCSRVYHACTFIRQKDNGMCVYSCTFTETCHDNAMCGDPDTTTDGTQRFRIGPFDPGACPGGDASIASYGEPD